MDKCKHCGKPASEHHAFEAKAKRIYWPKACKCNRGEWYTAPTKICGEYRASSYGPNCAHCEHDPECHKTTEAAP